MDSRRDAFVVATNQLVDSLRRTIDNAKKTFSSGETGQSLSQSEPSTPMSFEKLATVVPVIGEPAWTACWEWMKAIGVSNKQEAEELAASFDKDDKEVSKCMEELKAVEGQFDEVPAVIDVIIESLEKKEVKVSKLSRSTCMSIVSCPDPPTKKSRKCLVKRVALP